MADVTAAASCASCSQSYRNGPDVSANANFTYYVCADQTTCTANEYGGTSFAAPLWAGYLALVNQQRTANGNGSLGFINPALYTIGTGSSYDANFHDVTSGSNGYSATTGYDLATGWGSPNGTTLLNTLAGTVAQPGFSLSASPGAVSVVQGNAGSSTITSTVVGGFDAAVTLSYSTLPSGVTASFNPEFVYDRQRKFDAHVHHEFVDADGHVPDHHHRNLGSDDRNHDGESDGDGSGSGELHHLRFAQSRDRSPKGQSGYATVTTDGLRLVQRGDFAVALGTAFGRDRELQSGLRLRRRVPARSHFTLTVSRTAKTGTYPITITGTGGGVTKTTTFTFEILR